MTSQTHSPSSGVSAWRQAAQRATGLRRARPGPLLSAILGTLLVAAGPCAAQTHSFRFAKHDFDDAATFCTPGQLSLAAQVDRISAKTGLMSLRGKPVAQLPVAKGAFIDNLSALQHGAAIYWVFDQNFGGNGNGMVCRYSADGRKRQWCTSAGAFNASATAHGDALYVTSLGHAIKLDAMAGKRLWQHVDLYKKDPAFNIFKQVRFEGDQVVFVASAGDAPPYTRLLLNDATGKPMGMKRLDPGQAPGADYAFDKGVCQP